MSVSTNVSTWRHSTSSLQRNLYGYAPTVISTYISKKGFPTTISTCVSKEWNSTVISTDISTK